MAIRYRCRHCETEVGRLPFGSAEEVRSLHRLADGDSDDFITEGEDGEVTVQCICEHCEESLDRFPDYYALQKWLQ
ncbi:anti-sigma-F factor Fin family protein [Bhargavaea cecembensis]|uniref:anti-sigma-F factor Fin family protein n=1 Tax=Bhargavaea cecembensis TaxID=394098 RepID=UPI00058CC0A3|nr:anti-sigma-F factor Fin family protein [Bhargavaea cecembensis]